jgi:hypothetical protein
VEIPNIGPPERRKSMMYGLEGENAICAVLFSFIFFLSGKKKKNITTMKNVFEKRSFDCFPLYTNKSQSLGEMK